MIALSLVAMGTFFSEVATSIGKFKAQKNEESAYLLGFLMMFWGTLIWLGMAIFNLESFRFSWESLPTFIPRICLELALVHAFVLAILKADRTSFVFLRTLTIPLLLLVDVVLGYQITVEQLLGMGFVFFTLFFLFLNHRIKRKGIGLVLFVSITAVATITLYKYNITHFNSVVAEQLITHLIMWFYFFVLCWKTYGSNPFRFLKRRVYFFQSLSEGIGVVFISFAYLFAPASVITASKRTLEILWAMVSGNRLFNEKHVLLKLAASAMLVVGLVLLT